MLDYARAVPGAVSCITFMSCPSLSAVWAACRSAKNCVSREAIAIAYISTAADRQVPKGAQKAATITCAFCSILCHSSRKVKQNMSFDKCYFKCYIILYNHVVIIVDHHFCVSLSTLCWLQQGLCILLFTRIHLRHLRQERD